ncbi:MAG: hypothetical protein C4333_12100 [Meiothermus sp.]
MLIQAKIRSVDLRNASEAEYAALSDFANVLRAEIFPDDPPIPLEERRRSWQSIPPIVEILTWAVWEGGRAVATANAEVLKREENKHAMNFNVRVLPEFRRRAIPRRLLARVLETARQHERRLLIANTSGRIPAGEAFMERLGAERGLETHTNQLELAHLDRGLVRRWQEEAPARALGYRLEFVEGPYPEADYPAIADLINVMNTAPRDRLEVEDFTMTPRAAAPPRALGLCLGRLALELLRPRPRGPAGRLHRGLRPPRPAAGHPPGSHRRPGRPDRGYPRGGWFRGAPAGARRRTRPRRRRPRPGG